MSTIASRLHFRFSLWSLLVLTAYFALGLTALKLATHGWAVAVTTLTAIIFLWGMLRWFHGPTTACPFWSGFAVLGGGYLALLLILSWSQTFTGRSYNNDLASNQALEFLFRRFNPEVSTGALMASPNDSSIFDGTWYGPQSYASPYYLPNSAPTYAAPTYAAPALAYVAPPPGAEYRPTNQTEPDSKSAEPATATTPADVSADQPVPNGSPPANAPPATTLTPTPAYPSTNWAAQILPAGVPVQPDLQMQSRLRYFPRIGHCLFALAFGWIGGTLAMGMTAARAGKQPS